MSMQECIQEMKSIRQEFDTMRKRNKTLRSRYITLEHQVIAMLNDEKQPGVKFNDQAITINNKEKKLFNPRKKQVSDILSILENNGVRDAKEVFNQIENSKVKERLSDMSLKFTTLKKK